MHPVARGLQDSDTSHQDLPDRVTPEDPAVDVITDLRQIAAKSVCVGQTIGRDRIDSPVDFAMHNAYAYPFAFLGGPPESVSNQWGAKWPR